VIEPYAARRQADQLTVLGRSDEAADALLHVVRSPIAPRQRATAAEQAIATLRERGDANAALAIYRDVLAFAEQPAYRARTLVEAANLASSSGNFDQAIEWLLAALSEAPPAAEAVSALDALAALGVVPPDSAAAVEVYLAAERYQDALALAERALVATPGNAALLHLRGLARRGLGDFPTSLADLSAAGTADPNGAAGRQAQLDWIQTLGQSGDAERASAAYQEFAAAYSDDSRAPEALDRAAQLRDRLGDPVAAAQIYEALGRRFPQSTQGRAALHRLALQRFRSDEFAGARELWQILADNNNDAERARGAFWAGRAAAALGDSAAAEFYRVARSAAPESYYATRAAEELGEPFGGALALATPLTTADWQSLQDWIATWAGTPPVQNDDVLANYLSRAEELYAVGLLRQAGDEWLAAINAYQLDAYALATIAQAAVAAEQPDIALRAAQHLPTLAPTVSPQPAVLLRLRFPAPYNEAVREQSATYDLDPRLFLALMRQESLFDADATSWVGARGLAQVMPETGAWIAQQLTMHDFTVDDLYRPALSIRFGSYYLSERIANMNGSAHGALAAYNGGLGNAMRWAGGETVADPDLFVETIDFPETKGYVQAVYGFYGVYQDLYAEEN
jgi:soluble lytic murein transglycosylase